MKIHQYCMLCVCSVLAASCGPKQVDEPKRPVGLPDHALYAGGVDGGEWVSCKPATENRIVCTIFDPMDGEPRHEKSLRVCPGARLLQNGSEFRPRYFDAESAQFDGVPAYVDRPDIYFPRSEDTVDVVSHQKELAEKYFRDYGVTADCKPLNPTPPTTDR